MEGHNMITQDIYSHIHLLGNSLNALIRIYVLDTSKEKYSPTLAFWMNGVDCLNKMEKKKKKKSTCKERSQHIKK